MAEMKTIGVGDSLYFVPGPAYRGVPAHFVKIFKVGYRWLLMENFLRVEIDTLRVNGQRYSSAGHFMFYKSDHQKVFKDIHQSISVDYPLP